MKLFPLFVLGVFVISAVGRATGHRPVDTFVACGVFTLGLLLASAWLWR